MIECPECKTTYRPSTLGITLHPTNPHALTVECAVCKSVFEAAVTPHVVQPTWWARVVKREKERIEHRSVSLLRERR